MGRIRIKRTCLHGPKEIELGTGAEFVAAGNLRYPEST